MRTWLFCASLLTAGALFAQSGINGVWRYDVDRKDGTVHPVYLDLTVEGDNVTGTVIENFRPLKIRNGSYKDGKLHAEVNPWREIIVSYDGSLQNSELNLTVTDKRTPTSQPKVIHADAHRSTVAETKPPARIEPPALHDVPDNGLVRTPQMGWNSWNHFAGRVDDKTVRATADALVSTGMKDAGYIYVNIDDTWEGSRDAQGNIQTNKKFPDMKALADYVHSKGLKIGIYSSPGPLTCAGYEGSYGHEAQDAKTYASWGIDYLKYDWCSAAAIYKDTDMRAVYQKMGDALQASGRPIVYSLCQYGKQDVWNWGAKVGGNSWRTTDDISDSWKSMSTIGFDQSKIADAVTPGHWNDPDMLEVGNGGMTTDEYRVHMTLWALLSSPLLAGNDLEHMSDDTKSILMNKDVIAINQDPAVHHPVRHVLDNGVEIWTREMHDGSEIVAVFNRSEQEAKVPVDWAKAGISSAPQNGEDLWAHQNVQLGSSYTASVPTHGVVLLRIAK